MSNQQKIIRFQQNVLLSEHTTFKIGGPAKYFLVAKEIDDLTKAVKFAQGKKMPFFILGGGSNILVNDQGFKGLVIKNQTSKYEIKNNKIIAEAGVSLDKLVNLSMKKGLAGLECVLGILGTVGGAVYGNAGSQRNSAIGDLIEEVTLLQPNGQVVKVNKNWMNFDYRYSCLKKIKSNKRPIILSVVIKLKKSNSQKLQKTAKEKLAHRTELIPWQPSAGCIFKNFPDQSIGRLIEKAGLKRKKIGQAMVSEKHANFIINLGGAKCKDVLKLIDLIKKTIKEEFNLEIKEEIEYLGF